MQADIVNKQKFEPIILNIILETSEEVEDFKIILSSVDDFDIAPDVANCLSHLYEKIVKQIK
jgi:hypothetical protein